jgi:hypothetical protein
MKERAPVWKQGCNGVQHWELRDIDMVLVHEL